MKNALPYIIGAVVLVLLGAFIAFGSRKKVERTFEHRLTLKQKDKIPYGTAAAKTLLPSLFPNGAVYTDDKAPGYWNTISNFSSKQAVVFVAQYFNADEFEINQLLNFVKEGNQAFIIAKTFSYDMQNSFGFSASQSGFEEYIVRDSLSVKLDKNVFGSDTLYSFPGRNYESWFAAIDTAHAIVLGRNEKELPNFIQMKIGTGSVFIHTAPMAFTNYFILHKENTGYFQKVFSVLPDDVEKVVWDEYYLTKKAGQPKQKEKGLFQVLFRYPAFKWGLLTAAATLALFLFLFMRRRQRMIPPHQKPKNDSLDFVKTMGRLYHDRKDHRNLCHKMSVYFLEHVRSRYKLPTHNLDAGFVEALHYKSGFQKEGVEDIVSFIRYLQADTYITEKQLSKFHNQLESFYQNT